MNIQVVMVVCHLGVENQHLFDNTMGLSCAQFVSARFESVLRARNAVPVVCFHETSPSVANLLTYRPGKC
jgi:hypothetical protein